LARTPSATLFAWSGASDVSRSLEFLAAQEWGALRRKRSAPPKKPSVFRRSASIIDKIKGKRSFGGQRKSGHANRTSAIGLSATIPPSSTRFRAMKRFCSPTCCSGAPPYCSCRSRIAGGKANSSTTVPRYGAGPIVQNRKIDDARVRITFVAWRDRE